MSWSGNDALRVSLVRAMSSEQTNHRVPMIVLSLSLCFPSFQCAEILNLSATKLGPPMVPYRQDTSEFQATFTDTDSPVNIHINVNKTFRLFQVHTVFLIAGLCCQGARGSHFIHSFIFSLCDRHLLLLIERVLSETIFFLISVFI